MLSEERRKEKLEKALSSYEKYKHDRNWIEGRFEVYGDIVDVFHRQGTTHEEIGDINKTRDEIEYFFKNIMGTQENEIKNQDNEIRNARLVSTRTRDKKHSYRRALLTALKELENEV